MIRKLSINLWEQIWLPKNNFVYLRINKKVMECLKNVFAIVGLFATSIALYYFIKDQIAIYKLNQKNK